MKLLNKLFPSRSIINCKPGRCVRFFYASGQSCVWKVVKYRDFWKNPPNKKWYKCNPIMIGAKFLVTVQDDVSGRLYNLYVREDGRSVLC